MFSAMFSLWQSYDNGKCHFGLKISRPAGWSSRSTDIPGTTWPQHNKLVVAGCAFVGCSVVMTQKNYSAKTTVETPAKDITYISELAWEWVDESWRSSKVPWRLPLVFAETSEDNDGITDNTRKTSTTLWDWGVEEAFQPAVLSCCIEAFSKQRALVGLVIIRRQISLMSLSMSFKCSTISSTGRFFFGKGLFVRSKYFCECYLGILRLKNASFV